MDTDSLCARIADMKYYFFLSHKPHRARARGIPVYVPRQRGDGHVLFSIFIEHSAHDDNHAEIVVFSNFTDFATPRPRVDSSSARYEFIAPDRDHLAAQRGRSEHSTALRARPRRRVLLSGCTLSHV